MFQKNKADDLKTTSTGATIIAGGTVVSGDFESSNDLRIDGKVIGNIRCQSKVVIGTEGMVEGNIDGTHVDIMGKVVGSIVAPESLCLRGSAYVEGDINTGSFNMEPTAAFNGSCVMGPPKPAAIKNGKRMIEKNEPVFAN